MKIFAYNKVNHIDQQTSTMNGNSEEMLHFKDGDLFSETIDEIVYQPNYKYVVLVAIDEKKEWYNKLEQLKTYIDNYDQLPRRNSHIKSTDMLAKWMNEQIINSRKRTSEIMKSDEIYNSWYDFIDFYGGYFRHLK